MAKRRSEAGPGLEVRAATSPLPRNRQVVDRVLESVRSRIRTRKLSPRTEKTYLGWIERYLRFHRRRDPEEMGPEEAEAVALDRDLRRIWDEVASSGTTLELEEHRQWLWWLAVFFHKAEGFWIQRQRGLLSQETWAEWERAMHGFLQNQVGRDWWHQRSVIYAPEFFDFVDRLLEKGADYTMPSVRAFCEGSDEVQVRGVIEGGVGPRRIE